MLPRVREQTLQTLRTTYAHFFPSRTIEKIKVNAIRDIFRLLETRPPPHSRPATHRYDLLSRARVQNSSPRYLHDKLMETIMMEPGKKNATCFPIFSRAEYAMIAPGSYTLLASCFLLAPRDHRLTVVI